MGSQLMCSIGFLNRHTYIFSSMRLTRTFANSIWVYRAFESCYGFFLFFKRSQLLNFDASNPELLQNTFSSFCLVMNKI